MHFRFFTSIKIKNILNLLLNVEFLFNLRLFYCIFFFSIFNALTFMAAHTRTHTNTHTQSNLIGNLFIYFFNSMPSTLKSSEHMAGERDGGNKKGDHFVFACIYGNSFPLTTSSCSSALDWNVQKPRSSQVTRAPGFVQVSGCWKWQ